MRPVRRAGWVWAESCKQCPCSKMLRGLGVHAQARRIIVFSYFLLRVSPFLSPPRSAMGDEARRVEVQYRASVREAPNFSSSLPMLLQMGYTVCISNRDINRAYVGAIHF